MTFYPTPDDSREESIAHQSIIASKKKGGRKATV
jgi:hypothetical protein